jgi:hypothetical protein
MPESVFKVASVATFIGVNTLVPKAPKKWQPVLALFGGITFIAMSRLSQINSRPN